MSLRKQAKILGISPPYLSLLLNGKRPWRGNLKERYLELVNTFVNANFSLQEVPSSTNTHTDYLSSAMAGAGGSRTPRRHRRAPTNGFEVREAHQSPSTPRSNFVWQASFGSILGAERFLECFYRAESRRFLISAFGTAPTTWSTGLPPLKTRSVGMLLMPYFMAV
jgi:hypothetical protein